MQNDRGSREDLDRIARDWALRVQLGDATGPGETEAARAETLAEFDRWLAEDPAHAAAFDRMARVAQTSDVLAQGQVAARSQLKRAPFPQRYPILTGAIAATLVAAGSFTVYRMGASSNGLVGVQSVGGEASTSTVYITMVGQKRTYTLPDGSNLDLEGGSQVSVNYSVGARNLRLERGSARFTVAHDAKRAFAVDVGNGRVIAHGTIFAIALTERGVHVALVRGSIEVQKPGRTADASGKSRFLVPGQQLDFTASEPLPAPTQIAPGDPDWAEARLTFQDALLGSAVEEINRVNSRKVVLADTSLASLRISGAFDAKAPDTFAKATAQALGLRLTEEVNGNFLLSSRDNLASR
jgi:transmembrane sensor